MHNPEREARKVIELRKRDVSQKKFVPKVSPTDYHRFIYKCHTCLLGFKRRGMLVNHLAKRHPDMKPDSVPELNLPILRTQRDYYCQYCEKVYKSSSKRKAHIMKNHPGSQVPPSARKQPDMDIPGLPNSTFSTPIGSVTTVPHSCEFCHKQYASKAKLLQHQRKKHTDKVPPTARISRMRGNVVALPTVEMLDRSKMQMATVVQADHTQEAAAAEVVPLATLNHANAMLTVQAQQPEGTIQLQGADLLTQAMSELTQGLAEPQYGLTSNGRIIQAGGTASASITGGGAGVTTLIQPSLTNQPATIDLSSLGPAFAAAANAQFQTQTNGPITVSSPPAASAPNQVLASGVQPITVAINSDGQTQTFTLPISVAQSLIPRSWTSTNVTNMATFRATQQ